MSVVKSDLGERRRAACESHGEGHSNEMDVGNDSGDECTMFRDVGMDEKDRPYETRTWADNAWVDVGVLGTTSTGSSRVIEDGMARDWGLVGLTLALRKDSRREPHGGFGSSSTDRQAHSARDENTGWGVQCSRWALQFDLRYGVHFQCCGSVGIRRGRVRSGIHTWGRSVCRGRRERIRGHDREAHSRGIEKGAYPLSSWNPVWVEWFALEREVTGFEVESGRRLRSSRSG